MAEIPMSDQGYDPVQTRSVGTLVNWLGAAVSLGLIAGAGVWGYEILVRDVSGVPVVRAVEGPMRIQPEDPGGSPAQHQGLAVNNVAADGAAEKPGDRFVLAPSPVELEEADAVVTRTSAPAVVSDSLPPSALAEPEEIVAPPPVKPGEIASVNDLVEQLAAGAAPLGEVEQAAAVVPAAPEKIQSVPEPTETAIKIVPGGLGKSLRPRLRPASLGTQLASATPEAATQAIAPKVMDAADVPPGTRLVQLGAFGSAEIAQQEWDKMQARFGDYLGDKTRVIQKATSGGRVFYRLRAMGFADLSDARRLCSALKAENAECIPVIAR